MNFMIDIAALWKVEAVYGGVTGETWSICWTTEEKVSALAICGKIYTSIMTKTRHVL